MMTVEQKIPLRVKYEPKTFDEYVWRDPETRILIEKWVTEKNPPSVIIKGPPGLGKTTLVHLLMDALGIEPGDRLCLNASKKNGVDTIDGEVEPFCNSGGWSGMKIVFFDEADNMSLAAQKQLRGIIDVGSRTGVRFFFTANDGHLIHNALYGRCTTITLDELELEPFAVRLAEIASSEGIEPNGQNIDTIQHIVQRTYPNMRDAINLLEDRIIDGKLRLLGEGADQTAEWAQTIRRALTDGVSIRELRSAISMIRRDNMGEVFDFLNGLIEEVFPENDQQIKAIQILAPNMFRHYATGQAGVYTAFPEVNLADTVIKLMILKGAK